MYICADDVAYMENEKERFEYVLNDTGRIWVGTQRSNTGRPWYFGQVSTRSGVICQRITVKMGVKLDQ